MSTFNPNDYLMKLQGKDYLPVQARLLWLRSLHPDADLVTELINYEPGSHAMFRATITIPGRGSATGHGSEDPKGFRDFIEKAETKAIGRALGALGFGTQFTNDFDTPTTDSGEMRIVDSPVERPRKAALPPARETINLSDAKARLRKQGERLGADRLQKQSQVLFDITSAADLTPDQLIQLVEWAEAQND